jgi:hypothetical protein
MRRNAFLIVFAFTSLQIAQAQSSLTITSDPAGANVYLNNVFLGITPLSLEKQEAGEYILRLSLENYPDLQRKIVIEQGKNLSLRLPLQPSSGKPEIISKPSKKQEKVKTFSTTGHKSKARITGGLKVGLNSSKYYREASDLPYSYTTKNAPIIGGFLVFEINDHFVVQTELFLTEKGSGAEWSYVSSGEYGSDDSSRGDYYERLTYLEIPVLVKFRHLLGDYPPIKPDIYFGPWIGFLLHANRDVGDVSHWSSGPIPRYFWDNDQNKSKIDYGYLFGLGIEVPINKGAAELEIRYSFGLSQVAEHTDVFIYYNRVFSLLVGYTF